MPLSLDLKNIMPFVSEEELRAELQRARAAQQILLSKTGEGADFLGWIDLPVDMNEEVVTKIALAAKKIQKQSEVLLVIGIGGSYLGARAAIEFLRSPNYNLMKKDTPDIYFVGNNLSSDAVNQIITLIGERDFSINVISKSGTTTEPAVAFRIFKKLIEKKYGKEGARARIFATTDKARGVLKALADAEEYESFVIPDDVGGRFSVLTAVGLLPIAAAGCDIMALLDGARSARLALMGDSSDENPALRYAAARNALLAKGKNVEILGCYEPAFRYMAEWWKQLYGESEGKCGRGILPHSVDLTADLHSMGQYIQEGQRILFETIVSVRQPNTALVIEAEEDNADGLNFLAGKTLSEVNRFAQLGTILAHVDGGVPNLLLEIDDFSEYSLGWLIYFFEFACGVSGYELRVNPFNQPGVEAYKVNMFALLGKPGYEARREELQKRL